MVMDDADTSDDTIRFSKCWRPAISKTESDVSSTARLTSSRGRRTYQKRFLQRSSTRWRRSMESTWQRPSSATTIEEASVPQELQHDSRINTTTKVSTTVSDVKKTADVSDIMMHSPDVTKNIHYYDRRRDQIIMEVCQRNSADDPHWMRLRRWRLTTNV